MQWIIRESLSQIEYKLIKTIIYRYLIFNFPEIIFNLQKYVAFFYVTNFYNI